MIRQTQLIGSGSPGSAIGAKNLPNRFQKRRTRYSPTRSEPCGLGYSRSPRGPGLQDNPQENAQENGAVRTPDLHCATEWRFAMQVPPEPVRSHTSRLGNTVGARVAAQPCAWGFTSVDLTDSTKSGDWQADGCRVLAASAVDDGRQEYQV